MTFLFFEIPWLSLRSNHGLKLVNAFGVFKQSQTLSKGLCAFVVLASKLPALSF